MFVNVNFLFMIVIVIRLSKITVFIKTTLVLFIPTDVTVTCQDVVIIDRFHIYPSFIITVKALHMLAAVNT